MLDENLPTYRSRVSSDNPLHTILYFTHNGSEPSPDFLIKRPSPAQSPNQFAIGLFDVQYSYVLYAEVLVQPEWSQPTLSAAEVRANGGNPVSVPNVPNSFAVTLYNPEQSVTVKYQGGGWSKDSWEFEVPEKSFRTPTTSQLDQDAGNDAAIDLAPKLNFRWKRDSRMSRDMTCYMSGKTVNGKKSKEPDITIALCKVGKTEGAVAIYEPNMARVEVEDRKGLEMVLLLSAEVIRDLYLAPKADVFNNAGGGAPNGAKISKPPRSRTSSSPAAPLRTMTGGLNGQAGPPQPQPQQPSPGPADPRRAEIDAESRRLQRLVQEEQEMSRDRERRDREEQERIRHMLEQEEREERNRRQREVDAETERLRREYGVGDAPPPGRPGARSPPSPALPPRPAAAGGGAVMSGGGGGWFTQPGERPRPVSMGPNMFDPPSQPPPGQGGNQPNPSGDSGSGGGGRRQKLGQFLQSSPYGGPAAASVSGFFGGGSSSRDEEKAKKIKKKRSVHF